MHDIRVFLILATAFKSRTPYLADSTDPMYFTDSTSPMWLISVGVSI